MDKEDHATARDAIGRRRGQRHGHTRGGRRSHHPLYKIWEAMIRRCENPRDISYDNYGGRGIRVCPRWRASFADFLADMGERPTPAHQIDRRKTNGDYEPENCHWATRLEQMRNTRHSRVLTFGGETLCVAEWAARTGISDKAIYNRIEQGWSVERMLTTPPRAMAKRGTFDKMLALDGETLSVTAWAARTGLNAKTIHARLADGWDVAAALTAPRGSRLAKLRA